MKFRRKKIDPQTGQFYPHPQGFAGIGIHALESDRWMTIEEIMDAHKKYCEDQDIGGVPPTWGELIRDLGLFICFHMVDICDDRTKKDLMIRFEDMLTERQKAMWAQTLEDEEIIGFDE